jgi:hypothetical protein
VITENTYKSFDFRIVEAFFRIVVHITVTTLVIVAIAVLSVRGNRLGDGAAKACPVEAETKLLNGFYALNALPSAGIPREFRRPCPV